MNQPLKPFRIIGNIYYVGASDVTSFLIVTPKGHILLDSGFVETVPQIQQNVAELGFRLSDIKILINSHAHYDHAGGLAALKKLTGAKLLATKADAELLARGGTKDFHFGDRLSYSPVRVDQILNDGEKVELGGITLVAHLTPGHTKGCTTWTMKVSEGRKQHNAVFVGSVTVPGYNLINNDLYSTIVKDYQRSFSVLKGLPSDLFFASHGAFFALRKKSRLLAEGKKPNPFIDAAGYREFVSQSEKSFSDELKRQSQIKRQSTTAKPQMHRGQHE